MKDIVLIHELERLIVKKIAGDPDLAPTIVSKNEIVQQTMKITPIRTILIPTQIIPTLIPIDLCLQMVKLYFENHG